MHSHMIQIIYASAAGTNATTGTLLITPIKAGHIVGFLVLYHSQPSCALSVKESIGQLCV